MQSEMARVVVIGTSCVGKTTFAKSLARVLSFPHIELDAPVLAIELDPKAVRRVSKARCAGGLSRLLDYRRQLQRCS